MVKLTNQEIEKNLENEFTGEAIIKDVPVNSLSVFKFDIEENTNKLWENIQKPTRGNYLETFMTESGEIDEYRFTGKLWKVRKIDEKYVNLVSTRDAYFKAKIEKTKNGLKIETANGRYHYEIRDKKNGKGSEVLFNGPINSLGRQELIPTMTYVSGTLEGKFIDQEGKNLTPFMSANLYGELRKRKNAEIEGAFGRKGNEIDESGYLTNKFFNNELDFLPKYVESQEYKNTEALKSMGKSKTIDSYVKEKIIKRIEVLRQSKGNEKLEEASPQTDYEKELKKQSQLKDQVMAKAIKDRRQKG